MPDLSLEACHQFWNGFPDTYVYKAIVLLEATEDWTLDGQEDVEKAIQELSEAIDAVDAFTIQDQEKLAAVCSCVRMSRKLRLMQVIDQGDPGAASKLLSYAESNQSQSAQTHLFLRRNIIFERIRLISRMLSSERMSLMKKAFTNES